MICHISVAIIIALSLLFLHVKALRRIRALEIRSESSAKSHHETIQVVKLHLKRHEDILSNFENDRLRPMASNLMQLHEDQSELIIYCTKLFAEETFGAKFQRNASNKGRKI
jgi:hypothetical protein